MRIEPEIGGVGIVLLGAFNPMILTPAWFVLHGILPPAAAENANLESANPQGVEFSTEWLELHASPDRFQAITHHGPHIRVRDLVLRVFREHLFHTPVRVVGINRIVHFQAPSQADRDRMGRALAPLDPWREVAQDLESGAVHGGMASLTMRQYRAAGELPEGYVDITVEHSKRVGKGQTGIYVAVNDQYQTDGTSPKDHAKLFDVLEYRFEDSIRRADRIVDHIMALSEGG